MAIPDNSNAGADSTITVPNAAPYTAHQIYGLQIGLRLNHTRNADLDIYLVPPGVTWNRTGPNYALPPPAGVIELSTDNGGTNDNYGTGAGPYVYARLSVTTDPVFPSTQAITAGTVPYTANIYTVEGVAAFNTRYGTSPVGDWKLVVFDDQGGETGSLVSWELRYVHINTFTANPNIAIPDGSRIGVTSTITIPANGDLIGSFRVDLRIDHGTGNQLDIFLIPPWASWSGPYTLVSNEFSTASEALNAPIPRPVIELSTDNGNGANYGSGATPPYTYARLSSLGDPLAPGTSSVAGGAPPFTANVYIPEGVDWFDDVYGRPAAGNWTLVVADDVVGGAGTLRSWQIVYAPVTSGTLYASRGAANDPGAPIARGQAGQVLGQFRLDAVGAAANNVTSMVFREASGATLTTLISAASLYRDNNGDGLLDGGDTLLANAALAGATATFNFAQPIAADTGVNLLLVGTVVAAPAPASMQMEIQSAGSIASPLPHAGLFPLRAGPRPFVRATTYTYRPNQPDLILDNDDVGITRGITVPATSDRVGSLRVGIRLDHTYDADLDIYLLPPGIVWNPPYAVPNNGPVITAPPQVIELSTDNGGSGNNWGSNTSPYTYNYGRLSGANDPTWAAGSLVTGGAAPFTAQPQYRVEGTTAWNLSYNGDPSGTWQLIVVDSWGQDVGYLISWQIEYVPITTPQFWANIGDNNMPGLPATTGTTGNVFGQLELSAYFGSNSVTQVTAREVNNFTLANNLSAIALYRDVNQNGTFEAGTDTLVANGGMAGGVATFNIAGGFLVAANTTEFLLVVGTVLASPANTVLSLRHATNADIVGSTSEIAPYPLEYGAHPLNPPNTYVSTPPFGKSIPDNNTFGVTDTINIPATSDLIGALRIGIRIDHANDADLDIWLIPPGVTWAGPYTTINNGPNVVPPAGVIELSTDNGGTGDNYGTGAVSFVYTMLSRDGDRQFNTGNTPVTGGTAPFTAGTGYFVEGTAAFNAMYGTSPSGAWTIAIADDSGGGTGRLISWFVQYVPAERAQVFSVPTAGFSNFGSVSVGSPSAAQGFQAQNMGSFALTLPAPGPATGIRITGAHASDFVIQGTAPSGALAAGASTATFNIVFTPSAAGLRTANITVTWNNSDATMPPTATSNYAISGTGVVPTVTVTGGPLNFGNVEIGTNSAAQSYNVSGTFLTANIVVTPPASFEVALAAVGPWVSSLNLAPSGGTVASTPIFVRFSPTVLGAAAGNVTNASSGAVTQNIAVSGTGAGITVSTTGPLAFGNQQVGTPSGSQTYNVQGVGLSANLSITAPAHFQVALAAGGPWGASLSRTPAQAATLTTIFVRFNPTAAGAFSSNVTNASAPYTTRSVAVTGTGIAGTFSSPSPVNYGATNVFVTSPLSPVTHTITNTGPGTLTITAVNFIGTHAADWSFNSVPGLPHTIASGGSVNITASFTPQGTGPRSATLRVTDNSGGTPGNFSDIAVSGNALVGTLSTTTPVNYGSGNVGQFTNLSPVTHTLTNSGTGVLTITNLQFFSGDAADWSWLPPPSLPMNIGPGSSVNVQARLMPTATGLRTSLLRITSDSGGTSGDFDVTITGSGTAGVLSTPTPVDYGTGNLFTPTSLSPRIHTITNTGTGVLTITLAQFTGGDAAYWSFNPVPTFPIVIGVGGNAQVTAQLVPGATGALASTLRFTSDSGGFINTLTDVTVTGTGTVGTLSTATPVGYGSQQFGTPTAPVTHTVSNTGTGPLTVTAVTFTGGDAADWAFFPAAPTVPFVIGAGASVNIQAVFTPGGNGARTSTLRFTSDTGGTPGSFSNVTVDGNGISGTFSSPTPVNYGATNVFVTSPSSPVMHTITNTGPGTLTITALNFIGTDAADWSFNSVPGLPHTIASGGSVNITASFTPQGTGSRSATLRVTDNSGGTPGNFSDIAVSGNALVGTLSTTTPVGYGSSFIGTPTSPVTHTFNNTGTGPLTITALAFVGANAGDWSFFPAAPALPITIGAGLNDAIQARMNPSAAGPRTATLRITSDSGGTSGDFDVTVDGTGQIPTSVTGVTVSPDNGGPLTVTASVNGAPLTFIDVVVTYSGGANAGPPALTWASAGTITGSTIFGVPANTALEFRWDAYATERHVTDFAYVITLSPFLGVQPGTPGSSAPFALQRDGGWAKHLSPVQQATSVFGHCAVFDAPNDRMLIFAGKRYGIITNELWVYERSSAWGPGWQRLSVSGGPSARQYAAAVLDAVNHRMIVFGGNTSGGAANDTWALSLTRGAETWQQIATGSPATPAPRFAPVLAYDPAAPRAIMHGGQGAGYFADTWELDLTLGGESWGTGAVATGGIVPTARMGHAAALDPVSNRLVIYGGNGATGTVGDCHELDLTGMNWSPVTTNGAAGTRYFSTWVHDTISNQLMVSSGYRGSTFLGDTWVMPLQGGSQHQWSAASPDPAAGNGRVVGSAAFDAARAQALLFGGLPSTSVPLTALSVLDLAATPAWQSAPAAAPPQLLMPARWGATMALDATHNRVVIFGGKDAAGLFNDVWTLDRSVASATWVKFNATGIAPSPRMYLASAYDPVGQRLIVFGGQDSTGARLGDLWQLDLSGLSGGAWTQLSVGGGPTPRIMPTMVLDTVAQRLVLFGGLSTAAQNDTWVWDLALTGWSALAPTGTLPPVRYGAGGMFDASLNRMVVFGGQGAFFYNSVFVLDLTLGAEAWTNISAVSAPFMPSRREMAVAADPTGRKAWIFGGTNGGQFGDLWELDVNNPTAIWTLLAPPAPGPAARHAHAGCMDGNGWLVTATGFVNSTAQADTWAIDTGNIAGGWVNPIVLVSPTSLVTASVALDPVANRLIAFGGLANGMPAAGLWQLDLAAPISGWQTLAATGTGPTARRSATLVYEAANQRMILFGGRAGAANNTIVGEVWALNLSGPPAWTLLSPGGTPPGTRAQHVAVVDHLGRMVIWGGLDSTGAMHNTTFALDLSTLNWVNLSPTGAPLARVATSAVFDPVNQRMLVYGGSNNGATAILSVLSLSGAPAWGTMVTSGTSPGAVFYHSAVYDAAGHRMLLFGGVNGLANNRLYSLALGTGVWTLLNPPVAAPQPRWAHGAVWDAAGNRMCIVGGYVDGEAHVLDTNGESDVWFWGD
ncbi:MAG: choice-of-anchor D domain-containing protein [Planctomycetes bacterium]|nr:choice-of-anchor D domain-containing protein [Planctomycetota bacterium]